MNPAYTAAQDLQGWLLRLLGQSLNVQGGSGLRLPPPLWTLPTTHTNHEPRPVSEGPGITQNGVGLRLACLTMVFQLALSAEKRWCKLNGHALLAEVFQGVQFKDGIKNCAA